MKYDITNSGPTAMVARTVPVSIRRHAGGDGTGGWPGQQAMQPTSRLLKAKLQTRHRHLPFRGQKAGFASKTMFASVNTLPSCKVGRRTFGNKPSCFRDGFLLEYLGLRCV